MNAKKTSYEVGYGKPPKNTQFQKGASGNPRGRPKKPLDFDHELIKESKSPVTVTENGRPKRISKIQGIATQLTNKALAGNPLAIRLYLDHYERVLERVTLLAAQQPSVHGKYKDVKDMTDEELLRLINGGLEKTERES